MSIYNDSEHHCHCGSSVVVHKAKKPLELTAIEVVNCPVCDEVGSFGEGMTPSTWTLGITWQDIYDVVVALDAAKSNSEVCVILGANKELHFPDQSASSASFKILDTPRNRELMDKLKPKECVIFHTHPCGAFHSGVDSEHLLGYAMSVVVGKEGSYKAFVTSDLPCGKSALLELAPPAKYDIPSMIQQYRKHTGFQYQNSSTGSIITSAARAGNYEVCSECGATCLKHDSGKCYTCRNDLPKDGNGSNAHKALQLTTDEWDGESEYASTVDNADAPNELFTFFEFLVYMSSVFPFNEESWDTVLYAFLFAYDNLIFIEAHFEDNGSRAASYTPKFLWGMLPTAIGVEKVTFEQFKQMLANG